MIGKEWPILWELREQISLENDWFCVDLRNFFNETRRSYSIYSGFIPQLTNKEASTVLCFVVKHTGSSRARKKCVLECSTAS